VLLFAAQLPSLAEQPAANAHADRILVLKKDHKLILYREGQVLKEYRVALGGSPIGPKTRQGDHKTPEGHYLIDGRNPHSKFHLALHISYPTPAQVTAAHKAGFAPGGDVFIHGLPNGYGHIGAAHRRVDWTDGCIAVTNEEIEEIWRLVPNGAAVEIRP